MPQAGPDAIFDFLQICHHRVKFILGVLPPLADPQAAPGRRLPAIYRRIQAATPPPDRADKTPWEFGIRLDDNTEDGQPFQSSDDDDSWKDRGVFFVKDIASLDQPKPPSAIVLDSWLAVPARPISWPFTNDIDRHGFRSAHYPQPRIGKEGVTRVSLDYFGMYDLPWSRHLPDDSQWVAFSFDRFWPPERDSPEYIGQVQTDCDCEEGAAVGSA
ncbi:MAG TPA: hypothetical protein VHM23_10210 [Actinomycetota bacterium]|jgi:hypothetical protein|nr:hypothetical protein [Actinomycetota bacterium]